ncbi:MAG: RelA/SpoT protein [Parcubacteria group bacterium Gr01-1014_20]|nr:MAG: RelA/SpoT protein [Parcubacteria group bacterium Gr01-1014_20]
MLKNNDEIFNNLELLEEYAHITPDKAFQIVRSIVDTKRPLKTKAYRLKGLAGKVHGKSHEDLLLRGVKILDKIRYLETKKVVKILERLHQHSSQSIKSEVSKTFERLSQYNLFVLQQIEYKTQNLILDEVESWSDKKLIKNLEIICVIAKELLTPTFEGHSMPDYKTFTLHSGPLVVSDHLKNLRRRSISLLRKIYLLSSELTQKTKILQTLREATQTPRSHLYGDDMEQMVLENTNNIIDFYLEILPNSENEIIQDIEEQKIWFVRRFEKKPPKKINRLDEAIRSNSAYGMFRVFVGYDGRLDPDYDFNKDRETRSQKINEFVSDITETNFEEWRQKILEVIKNYSATEPGSYGYFEKFLSELGNKKPNLGIRLVEKNEKELAPFLINLLSGIWRSDAKEHAKKIISRWVDKGKYLYSWAFISVIVDDFDEKLFRKVIDKAKKLKDIRALNNTLRSILHHYPKRKSLKSVFIEILTELIKHKNTWWVENLWFKGEPILLDLTEKELHVILDGLLLLPNVDYREEEILKPIAEKYPEKVINFFHERVEMKSKKKRGIDDRYDGVPFNFHKLGETLRKHEEVIVPMLLKWYGDGGKNHNWLFSWEASHLFEEIFPGFSPILEQSLIDLIKKGSKNSRNIVFSVLSKYEGGKFLWGIVKALVRQYADTKEYERVRGNLFGYLSQTGVVSGEDGFVRAYQAKKQEIQELGKDSDKRVKRFVREYGDYLDKHIVHEQKRTNEQIELMKRGLG